LLGPLCCRDWKQWQRVSIKRKHTSHGTQISRKQSRSALYQAHNKNLLFAGNVEGRTQGDMLPITIAPYQVQGWCNKNKHNHGKTRHNALAQTSCAMGTATIATWQVKKWQWMGEGPTLQCMTMPAIGRHQVIRTRLLAYRCII
jgi:hypothetical protein